MAIIYRAHIQPTKIELLAGWLPSQPWYAGPAYPELTAVGAYRFDDPDGEVGIETHLVRADDGPLLQVPLTYRGKPLAGGERWLVGNMEHSVLGERWVYDGCGDPVYATALAATILRGGREAEEVVDVDGRPERRTPTMSVAGTGSAGADVPAVTAANDLSCSTDDVQTVISAAAFELVLRRVVGSSVASADDQSADNAALTGTWAGQDEPVLLATARRTDGG